MINWEMIGVVIGAIAIEISIVYLALQIRQDGRVVRFKAHQTRSDETGATRATRSHSLLDIQKLL